MHKSKEEGWKTIKGNHVLIGSDGTIQKGPKSITGKKVSELSGESTSSKKSTSSSKKSTSSSAKKSSTGKKSSTSSKKSTGTKKLTSREEAIRAAGKQVREDTKKYIDKMESMPIGKKASSELSKLAEYLVKNEVPISKQAPYVNKVLDKYAKTPSQKRKMLYDLDTYKWDFVEKLTGKNYRAD